MRLTGVHQRRRVRHELAAHHQLVEPPRDPHDVLGVRAELPVDAGDRVCDAPHDVIRCLEAPAGLVLERVALVEDADGGLRPATVREVSGTRWDRVVHAVFPGG